MKQEVDNRIPRYSNPNFKQKETPNGGKIKSNYGGKVFKDGIVRYPVQSTISLERAAKAQALIDYNGQHSGDPVAKAELIKTYGDFYKKEFARLQTAKRYED